MAMSPELEKRYLDRFYADQLADAKRSKANDESGAGGWTEQDQALFDDNWKGNIKDVKAAIANSATSSSYRDLTTVFDDDPASAAFREKFGEGELENVEENDKKLDGLMFSYERPKMYGKDFEEWAQDPSRIMQLDDGRWVWEAGNMKGDWLASEQSKDDDKGLGDSDAWWRAGLALVVGGGLAYNALGAGAVEGAGIAETATGTVSTDGAALGDVLTTGPEGLVEGVTSGSGGTNLGTYGGMTTGLDGGLVNTVASGGVNAAAGTIPTAAANAGWSIPGWSALSPGAQRVVLAGLSSGASAMVNTRNAERAITAANNRQENQQDFEREERERRGRPPAAIATVRPRAIPGGFAASGGLTDKYMTPRGG